MWDNHYIISIFLPPPTGGVGWDRICAFGNPLIHLLPLWDWKGVERQSQSHRQVCRVALSNLAPLATFLWQNNSFSTFQSSAALLKVNFSVGTGSSGEGIHLWSAQSTYMWGKYSCSWLTKIVSKKSGHCLLEKQHIFTLFILNLILYSNLWFDDVPVLA